MKRSFPNMAEYLAAKGLSTGRAQDDDWIDAPLWTPEEQEKARLAAERKKQMEALKSEPEYQWYVGYGGTE